MGFGQAVQSAYKRYVDFQGRSARSEYWWFYLFYILTILVLAILMGALRGPIGSLFSLVYVAFTLGSLLPALGLSVRRLHDLDKSGWWIFISLVPIVGAILLIVWYCTKGTTGENKFGADPLGAPAAEVFA